MPGQEEGSFLGGLAPYTGLGSADDVAQGWSIHGSDMQVLHVPLEQASYAKCESGCMMYCSEDVSMSVTLISDGGSGGAGSAIMGAVGGALSGEGLFCQKWSNNGAGRGYVGITNNLPGKMIPIFGEQLKSGFTVKRGAWVANINAVAVRVKLLSNASCLARCCGGMSLFVQGLKSQDENAVAFIQGMGTILSKELAAGESMLCDGESLLGFSDSVAVDCTSWVA